MFPKPPKGTPPIGPHKGVRSNIGPGSMGASLDLDPKFVREVFHTIVIRYLEAVIKGIDSDTDRAWVVGHIEAYKSLEILDDKEYKEWLLRVDIKDPKAVNGTRAGSS